MWFLAMRGLNRISQIDRMLRMIFKINPDYPKIRVILFKRKRV